MYPQDYLPTVNQLQSKLIEIFVKGLEEAFEVKREVISLAEEWEKDCPDGPENPDIAEYLRLVRSPSPPKRPKKTVEER